MANVIIGIHGLANKPEKSILSEWWEAAIREGLSRNCNVRDANFKFIMVYWADLLYKYPQHQDPDFKHDSLYVDEPYVEAAPGTLVRYDQGWLDEARKVIGGVGGSVLDKVRGRVGLDAVADWLLEQKFRDLAFYFDNGRHIIDRLGQKRQARQILMDELTVTLEPVNGQHVMLIAHSMGSIIAYDVLRNLGHRDRTFPVHHFVTIGSPLGLQHVKSHLDSEWSKVGMPLRTPTVVRERWVNYADPKDPVAIDPHLRDEFGPNDAGVWVEDATIINDYVSPTGKKSSHKSYGYLRTPELSQHFRDFLA